MTIIESLRSNMKYKMIEIKIWHHNAVKSDRDEGFERKNLILKC